jgi:hypothetical protein
MDDLGEALFALTGLNYKAFLTKIESSHPIPLVPHTHSSDGFVASIFKSIIGKSQILVVDDFKNLAIAEFDGLIVIQLPPWYKVPLNGYYTHDIEKDDLTIVSRLGRLDDPMEYSLVHRIDFGEEVPTSDLIAIRHGKEGVVTNYYPIDEITLEILQKYKTEPPRTNLFIPASAFCNRLIDCVINEKGIPERFQRMVEDKNRTPSIKEFERGFYVRYQYKL